MYPAVWISYSLNLVAGDISNTDKGARQKGMQHAGTIGGEELTLHSVKDPVRLRLCCKRVGCLACWLLLLHSD